MDGDEWPHAEWFDHDDVVRSGMQPETGVRIRLALGPSVARQAALVDIFTSDVARLSLPELSIERDPGVARLTTVRDLVDELRTGSIAALEMANQATSSTGQWLQRELATFASFEVEFVVEIYDPLGISGRAPNGPSLSWYSEQRFRRSVHQCHELDLPLGATLAVPAPAWAVGVAPPIPEHPCDEEFERLVQLCLRSQRVVALTGAGISTESGVPSFRSAEHERGITEVDGKALPPPIWTQYDPAELCLRNLHSRPETRHKFWRMHRELHLLLTAPDSSVRPNAAHRLFAWLAAEGRLRALLTQNIDGLHQAAGVDDRLIVQLHGTMRRVRCLKCAHEDEWSGAVVEAVDNGDDVSCGRCGGFLIPAVVPFGGELDPGVLARARAAAADADLFLVMGTGLAVAPANTLPQEALNAGVPLAIVNMGATVYDRAAAVVIDDRCGRVMADVMDAAGVRP